MEEMRMENEEVKQPTKKKISKKSKGVVVKTPLLRFRVEPNTKCDTLELLPEGTEVSIFNDFEDETFLKATHNGKTGYLMKFFIEMR